MASPPPPSRNRRPPLPSRTTSTSASDSTPSSSGHTTSNSASSSHTTSTPADDTAPTTPSTSPAFVLPAGAKPPDPAQFLPSSISPVPPPSITHPTTHRKRLRKQPPSPFTPAAPPPSAWSSNAKMGVSKIVRSLSWKSLKQSSHGHHSTTSVDGETDMESDMGHGGNGSEDGHGRRDERRESRTSLATTATTTTTHSHSWSSRISLLTTRRSRQQPPDPPPDPSPPPLSSSATSSQGHDDDPYASDTDALYITPRAARTRSMSGTKKPMPTPFSSPAIPIVERPGAVSALVNSPRKRRPSDARPNPTPTPTPVISIPNGDDASTLPRRRKHSHTHAHSHSISHPLVLSPIPGTPDLPSSPSVPALSKSKSHSSLSPSPISLSAPPLPLRSPARPRTPSIPTLVTIVAPPPPGAGTGPAPPPRIDQLLQPPVDILRGGEREAREKVSDETLKARTSTRRAKPSLRSVDSSGSGSGSGTATPSIPPAEPALVPLPPPPPTPTPPPAEPPAPKRPLLSPPDATSGLKRPSLSSRSLPDALKRAFSFRSSLVLSSTSTSSEEEVPPVPALPRSGSGLKDKEKEKDGVNVKERERRRRSNSIPGGKARPSMSVLPEERESVEKEGGKGKERPGLKRSSTVGGSGLLSFPSLVSSTPPPPLPVPLPLPRHLAPAPTSPRPTSLPIHPTSPSPTPTSKPHKKKLFKRPRTASSPRAPHSSAPSTTSPPPPLPRAPNTLPLPAPHLPLPSHLLPKPRSQSIGLEGYHPGAPGPLSANGQSRVDLRALAFTGFSAGSSSSTPSPRPSPTVEELASPLDFALSCTTTGTSPSPPPPHPPVTAPTRPRMHRGASDLRRWTLAEFPDDVSFLRALGKRAQSEGGHDLALPADEVGNPEEEEWWREEGQGDAGRALLCVREIVRTEESYRRRLEGLYASTQPLPPTLLTHLPALILTSSHLSRRLSDDPSAWGAAAALLGCEDEMERTFVGWCAVVGDVVWGVRAKRARGKEAAWAEEVREVAVAPTQRVPRYVLLYKELLLHTPSSSPSRPLVERALEGALRIATRCDAAQRHRDSALPPPPPLPSNAPTPPSPRDSMFSFGRLEARPITVLSA